MSLDEQYLKRYRDVLAPSAAALEALLKDQLEDVKRIDRITSRPKSPDRFLAKAEKMDGGRRKYRDPLHEIQDQIGARIVVFYLSDIEIVRRAVERYPRHIERRAVEPVADDAFGYRGF